MIDRLSFLVPSIAISALVLAVLGWAPASVFWSLDHAEWFSWPALACILGCFIALSWFMPVGDMDRKSSPPGYLSMAVIFMVATAVFRLLQTRVVIQDSAMWSALVEQGTWLAAREPLSVAINQAVFRLVRLAAPEVLAIDTMAAVSCVAGGVYVAFAWRLSHGLASTRNARIALFLLMAFSGSTLVLYGYVENYALLCAGLMATLHYLVEFGRTGKGATALSLATALTIGIHLIGLFLLPAVFLVLWWRRSEVQRARALIAFLVPAAIVGILVVMSGSGDEGLGVNHIGGGDHGLFVGLPGTTETPDRLVFLSPRHAGFLANVAATAFIPVVYLGLCACMGRAAPRRRAVLSGLALNVPFLAFLLLWHPDLMEEDLTLMAVSGTPFLVSAAYLVSGVANERLRLKCLVFAALLSMLITMPTVLSGHSRDPAGKYFGAALLHAGFLKDYDTSDRYAIRALSLSEDPRVLVLLGENALARDRPDRAREYLQRGLALDPPPDVRDRILSGLERAGR